MHRRYRTTLALSLVGLITLGSTATASCGGDDTDAAATAVTASAPTVADTTAPATTAAPVTTSTAPATTTTAAPATTTTVVEPGPLEIVTRDYAFDGMPDVLRAGTYQVSVHNEGAELHEFVVFRPTTGKTLEELAAIGPAGFLDHAELAAYLPGVAPGEALPAEMTLEPGEWTLVCFLPAAFDEQPHFAHGMTKTITVVP